MSVDRPTRAEQVEQALARGRSLDWITTHLGASTREVDEVLRRRDAANRTPDHAADVKPPPHRLKPGDLIGGRPYESYFGPAHPDVLAALLDELMPRRPDNPERVATVRALAHLGRSDTAVGARVGMSSSGVRALRKRHGIPAGRTRRREAG